MENTNEQSISNSHSDSKNINHDFCEKNNYLFWENLIVLTIMIMLKNAQLIFAYHAILI